jgi:hypothetical protein
VETIRSDGRIDGADPAIAALTGRIEVRFADQLLVNQAINGEPCEMSFATRCPRAKPDADRPCRLSAAPAHRDFRAAGRAGHIRLAGCARRHTGADVHCHPDKQH